MTLVREARRSCARQNLLLYHHHLRSNFLSVLDIRKMSGDFASLAAVQLPTPCRLLASACCPDKDLLVLVTRLGSHDRISLWKMQGSKTWEIDVSTDSERIVGVAWSPDGTLLPPISIV